MARPQAAWRGIAAGLLFLSGLFAPAAIPLVAGSALPGPVQAILSAALLFGLPELLWIAAVSILGRAGFESAKAGLFRLLRRAAPPDRVSPVRYRIGLVMFSLPLVIGWSGPYLLYLQPETLPLALPVLMGGDLLFLASFFCLGGAFWDKLRALFVPDAP